MLRLLGISATQRGVPYAGSWVSMRRAEAPFGWPDGDALPNGERLSATVRNSLLISSVPTAQRWAAGNVGRPNPIHTSGPGLGQILQVTAGELAVLLTPGPEHELSSPTPHPAPAIVGRVMSEPDLTDELGDMYRRELLRLLSVAGALMALPPGAADATEHSWIAQPEGAGDVQQYALLNTQLWQVFGLSKSKRLVYPLVHEHLGQLIDEILTVPTHRLSTASCAYWPANCSSRPARSFSMATGTPTPPTATPWP